MCFFRVTGRSRFYFNTLGVFYLPHRLSSFQPRDYRVVFLIQLKGVLPLGSTPFFLIKSFIPVPDEAFLFAPAGE